MNKVVVIIPIYKIQFTAFELSIINNNIEKLKNYKIYIIGPERIKNVKFDSKIDIIERILLNDLTFSSIEAYNKLLRSPEFYKLFINFEYLLIVQSDAYIFGNNLSYFTQKNYDYWGAPWIDYELINYSFLSNVLPLFHKKRIFKPLRKLKKQYLVGNGGLSLRRISTHYFFASKYRKYVETFEKDINNWIDGGATSMMEDVFWCLYVPKIFKNYEIAPWQEAIKFSFELNPRKAYKLNDYSLPFGCHAFEKIDKEFYSKLISTLA